MQDDGGLDGLENGLEDFFAAARAASGPVPEALVARVLADAAAVQPPAASLAAASPSASPRAVRGGRAALWARAAGLGAFFGGGASLAGLVLAGAAGVWIGFAQPFELGLQAATLEGLDLFPDELEQWSAALDPELQAADGAANLDD